MQVDTGGVRKKPRLYRQGRMTMTKGATLTARQRAQVKGLIARSSELKYLPFSSGAATTISSTMSISNTPFQIAQGVTDTDRVGDSVNLTGSICFRFNIVNGIGATGDEYNNMRVTFVQWHPNSTPAAADIFINGPSGVADVYSQFNHDKRQMYKVLYDKVYATVGNANAAQTPGTSALQTGVITDYVSLKKAVKHIQYAGGGVTGTNLIYICLVSDSALATHPNITYTTKLFYRDS